MWDWLLQIFDVQGFPPRWACGVVWRQQPAWGWIHIAADLITWAAYSAIPLVLWFFLRRRHDIPFPRIFWLFGAFIFACGTGHLLEAAMFYWPAYRLAGLVKLFTAIISGTTVYFLIHVLPEALALKSPAALEREVELRTRQLKELTEKLQIESVERRRMAANWHESEEQLQLALKAGGMGIWNWDFSSGRVHVTPMEAQLLGRGQDSGEIHINDFFEVVHPDDLPALTEALNEAIELGHPFEHEFRIRRPNHDARWLGARGLVIHDAEGKPLRMIGINFDITRRKQDEIALRLKTRAIEFATNGVVIADALHEDFPIVMVNHAFEELTGYRANMIVGRNCRVLQGAETSPETRETIRRALEEKRECAVTILNYRQDGTPFWNDLRIAPIFDEQDRVTHYVGIQSDVTERIATERALQQARETADAASRAKSRFLASMSHEIRTPLTAVLGCADILCRRVTAPADRELAQVIRNQGESLLQLLNDVLDLSKIEAGKLELRMERRPLRTLVDDVTRLINPLASEKGIALETHVASDVPEYVLIDHLRVRQILLNLLSNAVKFTDVGGVELGFHFEPEASGTSRLGILISDTGVGIPPERIKELFHEFAQLEQHQPGRGPGTGLGLSIVRRLIDLHSGEIHVTSEVGRGTSIRILLPLGDASAGALSSDALDTSGPNAAGGGKFACRVLVAEDTRSLQFMLQRMLADHVARLEVVSNGAEAVAAVEQAAIEGQPVDIILMDMQMPVLTGYEATQQLRERGYEGTIVALTAGAMEGERERCLSMGCTDYLPKPLDRDQLLRTLERYCQPG